MVKKMGIDNKIIQEIKRHLQQILKLKKLIMLEILKNLMMNLVVKSWILQI